MYVGKCKFMKINSSKRILFGTILVTLKNKVFITFKMLHKLNFSAKITEYCNFTN